VHAEKSQSEHSSHTPGLADVWGESAWWRVVVPVLDEAVALPGLLAEMASLPGLLSRVVFVDNGSVDGSPGLIAAAGGRVVQEPRRGYGYACLAGAATAAADLRGAATAAADLRGSPPDRGRRRVTGNVPVVAFMEGDGTDDPAQLARLVGPVLSGDVDLVVGSRRRAVASSGGMPVHQRWGNRLTVILLRMLFDVRLPDNGPYRAIRLDLLEALSMEPRGFAWTTEMVVKAHVAGARITWVDTSFRSRAGRSKIAGSVRGTIGAFRGIFGTMLRLRVQTRVRARRLGSSGWESVQYQGRRGEGLRRAR
jgi:glycosyltransferase involved in cell wall biosynthesis